MEEPERLFHLPDEMQEFMEALFPGWDVQTFNYNPLDLGEFAALFMPEDATPEIEPA